MSPAEVLQLAVALLHQHGGKVVYRKGADLDGDPIGCDCSAFLARCCGQRKEDSRGLWWNTDRIYGDAQGGHVRWQQIAAPEPGCIGVWPGRTVRGKRRSGHVFVVRDVAAALTVECCDTGHGIAAMHRLAWFAKGALGNGRPIIWARFVG